MTNNSLVLPAHISCRNVSKKFIQDTVIKNASFEARDGELIAITGPNGSGKSSFLQLISGHSTPTSGSIIWRVNEKTIDASDWYTYLSVAAPYIDLIDEYTVDEMIDFHFGFKSKIEPITTDALAEMALLAEHAHKRVKTLSSGMKQRLKLTLALLSNTPVVLLDEPTTNLDTNGKTWFARLLATYLAGRLVFIATNDAFDIKLCNRELDVMRWK